MTADQLLALLLVASLLLVLLHTRRHARMGSRLRLARLVWRWRRCHWVRGRFEAQRRAVVYPASTGHALTPPAARW
jgi:hypothetical protein